MQTTKTFISSQCDAAVVVQADLHFLSKSMIRTTTTTARSAQTDSVYSFLIGLLCAICVSFFKNIDWISINWILILPGSRIVELSSKVPHGNAGTTNSDINLHHIDLLILTDCFKKVSFTYNYNEMRNCSFRCSVLALCRVGKTQNQCKLPHLRQCFLSSNLS